MKPRTPIQQEVARLSERLPKLTATQRAYAFRHCFKHYAIKRADGTNICTECGHSWRSEHDLADTVCGCTCPHCGMKLEALRTRKSVFSENEYFCIITTCKQYQVIRFFFVKSRYKAGQAAEYSIYEVVQRWISPKGTTVTVARLRGMSILYYDLWAEYSDMEVRKNNKLRAYDIKPRLHLSPTAFHTRTETQRLQWRIPQHTALRPFHGYPFRQPSRNAVEGRAISHVAPLHPQFL